MLRTLWWGLAFLWACRRWSTREQWVIARVAHALNDPAWPLAQQSVADTATTLGLNRPESWGPLQKLVQDRHIWAENLWRHTHAVNTLHKHTKQTRGLTNPELHLLTELAYVAYTRKPR